MGVVTEVGDGVSESYVGQRVASVMAGIGGAYTSDLVVPVEALAVLPEDVSSQIAAASIESYQTVLFGVTQRVTIREGKTVVVLGAGGGIGLTAVDVARGQGAEVPAVASSEEKRALGTGGRFYVIGFASGEIPGLPANIVLLRNRMIVGID